jgi:hypothetical protein
MNDDLPVKVGHYIWNHGLEGGQGVFWLFINLSLNFAPHEITKELQSFELGGQISLDQWSFRLAFTALQPVLGDFGYVLGGQATKSTVLMRPKDLFCVNFELEGQISRTSGPSGWPSASPG